MNSDRSVDKSLSCLFMIINQLFSPGGNITAPPPGSPWGTTVCSCICIVALVKAMLFGWSVGQLAHYFGPDLQLWNLVRISMVPRDWILVTLVSFSLVSNFQMIPVFSEITHHLIKQIASIIIIDYTL